MWLDNWSQYYSLAGKVNIVSLAVSHIITYPSACTRLTAKSFGQLDTIKWIKSSVN